ncbi:LacI family DNA-binding transcriptional regulator [Bifidobacterium stellenboschense]|uniref:LacI family sucrose operon transcriptional repressor n=1 Tax=Bifidobacterium stellenboschense TaxID=762211 RepID=A0A087DJP4_9BIFI|nr:LacI family DNA-binding transcriptional regulator [Bifidobacterium stellenboschense]KFI95744.1 LacI family sucrose operon transcriptional repressor [Bifidobacterium stellenboschense]
MVGMRDVARRAGTSVSTVSLVVNGTGYVSDEMRKRVQDAMDALGYIPNELARNFYRDRTNMVGVIVPTVRHPFFATFVAALQRGFSARGMRVVLCSVADTGKDESEYIDMLRRHMMDGIVMAAHTRHPADYWTSIDRPIVAFDRYLGEGVPSVRSDHEQGGRIVARELIASGARHVALVGGPRAQFHDLSDDDLSDGNRNPSDVDSLDVASAASPSAAPHPESTFPTVRYYLTLERELDAAGIAHEYVEAGGVDDFAGYVAAVRGLFDRRGRAVDGGDAGNVDGGDGGVAPVATDAAVPPVDAIVGNDVVAALAVQEAARRGIRVPDDLQIVAYDGTYLVDAAGVRLTAVAQDFGAIAERIVDRMIALIGGGGDGGNRGGGDGGNRGDDDAAVAGAGGGDGAGDAGAIVNDGDGAGERGVTLVPLVLRKADSTR